MLANPAVRAFMYLNVAHGPSFLVPVHTRCYARRPAGGCSTALKGAAAMIEQAVPRDSPC
eukprot:1747207-Pleurochrysis_carterae.AAC.1